MGNGQRKHNMSIEDMTRAALHILNGPQKFGKPKDSIPGYEYVDTVSAHELNSLAGHQYKATPLESGNWRLYRKITS